MAGWGSSPLLSSLGIVAVAGAVTPMACSDGGGGAAPIEDVADIIDVYQDVYTFYCECYGEAYGYSPAEVDECLSQLDIASDSEQACLDAVYDANPDAFDVLRCQAEALRSYVSCKRAEGCPSTFMCGDGTSVPETFVCDGTADCNNGVDEQQGCPPPFTCDDGRELPPSSMCDGFSDCIDESDEAGCPGGFSCGDTTEVPAGSVCDGFPDCADGSDEQQACPVTCESQLTVQTQGCGDVSEEVGEQSSRCFDLECGDGQVIPGAQRCDGTPDCADGEDELFCSSGDAGTG